MGVVDTRFSWGFVRLCLRFFVVFEKGCLSFSLSLYIYIYIYMYIYIYIYIHMYVVPYVHTYRVRTFRYSLME